MGLLGFFNRVSEELVFFHDYSEPARSSWTALHEGTHLLTYLIEPQAYPQIWVNEGVADYFGSATIAQDKKGKLVIEPGQIQVDRILTVQQAIKDKKNLTLEDLFKLDRSNFTGFAYAHAWSFIYFLNNKSSEYEKGFKKFFKDFYTIPKTVAYEYEIFPNQQGTAKIIAPEEVRRLLLEKLGVKDVEALEKQWLEFIAAIEISGPEARFKRGYNALRFGRSDEFDGALKDLDAAIEGGIEDPRAFWARGRLRYLKKKDFGDVQADFERAVELAPLDAEYRSDLGLLLARMDVLSNVWRLLYEGEDGKPRKPAASVLKPTPEQMEWAREELGLACELEPENEYYRETFDEFLGMYAEFQSEADTK
jgi:tetratricopeptide (TPR) repeat protein